MSGIMDLGGGDGFQVAVAAATIKEESSLVVVGFSAPSYENFTAATSAVTFELEMTTTTAFGGGYNNTNSRYVNRHQICVFLGKVFLSQINIILSRCRGETCEGWYKRKKEPSPFFFNQVNSPGSPGRLNQLNLTR